MDSLAPLQTFHTQRLPGSTQNPLRTPEEVQIRSVP
ncbi:uncharacterized protein WCI35_008125, partial [Daubentonia madagascariensis]